MACGHPNALGMSGFSASEISSTSATCSSERTSVSAAVSDSIGSCWDGCTSLRDMLPYRSDWQAHFPTLNLSGRVEGANLPTPTRVPRAPALPACRFGG